MERAVFTRDGVELTTDFYAVIDGVEVLVPFDNLYLWDETKLAACGVTKTMVSVVPPVITRRQCALALLNNATINVAEALAMTKQGDMPVFVANIVAQLPTQDERDRAAIDFAANSYLRSNPLLVNLMAAAGATSEQIDQFFITAAQL